MLGVAPLEAPVTPAAALRCIAYLLERSRAGTYRVQAFRKALGVIGAMEPDELAARATAGTLADLPGIGETTATVIAQAVRGQLPAYLVELQGRVGHPLADSGELTYAALTGDLHSHTDWSDGGSPLEEMALTAIELGQSWLAITDHSPRLKVANGLSAARLTQQIARVRGVDAALGGRFRLLTGIEVDILDDGSLDQTSELLGQLDVVTASVHSKLAMASAPMTRRMVAAVENPRVNVLGHVTGRLVEGSRGTRAQSAFDAREVFTACAATGTAVEINSRPERCDPPDELVRLALDLGCLFAVDSDAHAPGQLDMKGYGAQRTEALDVPVDRIVTTWPVERLLAWVADPASER